ncbi:MULTISPECIES: DUF1877 family protein [Calothrix]|uniref:DUF1877 family protein n=1 Tax=Calothrix TaxID=1186 RepID=UPI0016896184|nr:DUF1877 family protein [Calothrix parietina]
MGITLQLKQVNPYLLEKFKKYPDFAGLFLNAKYLEDSPFWQNFIIDPDDPDDVDWFNEATNYVNETLDKLSAKNLEQFNEIKEDIPLIIAEGKGIYLDLDKTWRPIFFLLTGYHVYDETVNLSEIVVSTNKEDNLPLINAVLGGNGISYYGCDYPLMYLTADEVRTIANALSNFSLEQLGQRLKYRGLKEDDYNHLFDYTYNPLVKYYQDAADKGNAMFLNFG